MDLARKLKKIIMTLHIKFECIENIDWILNFSIQFSYSSDERFLVEHTRHLGNWALRIKNARKDDEGIYECQISTHPPESIFIELRIVGELEKKDEKRKNPMRKRKTFVTFSWMLERVHP